LGKRSASGGGRLQPQSVLPVWVAHEKKDFFFRKLINFFKRMVFWGKKFWDIPFMGKELFLNAVTIPKNNIQTKQQG
jgi:hypothetical protein